MQLVSAVSRKTHGSAGTFDIELPQTGNPGIECRSGGITEDYTILLTFTNNVSVSGASVTSGIGSVNDFSVAGNEGHKGKTILRLGKQDISPGLP